jgi:hypothetical protein
MVQPFSEPSPPLPTPLGGLDSPQSLFALSPEAGTYSENKLQYEYFPARPGLPHRSSTSVKTISSLNSLAQAKIVKSTPVLLLVEDNEINMRVCCYLLVKLETC